MGNNVLKTHRKIRTDKSTAEKKSFDRFLLIESISWSIIIAIALYFAVFLPVSYVIHECGHVLGGAVNDISIGRPTQNYTFTNWVPTIIPFLSVPQQTSGPSSKFMVLGGQYFTILFLTVFILAIYYFLEFKTKEWLGLIPIYIVITEIVNNFFCGTDNYTNKPLSSCTENQLLSFYFNWNFLLLIAIFFVILFPLIRHDMPYWVDTLRKIWGHKQEYL